ncbi:MAG: alkaline phosphatase family protein, partial [Muribaculaceae bacterium]|nr:alkaline phosphatase family protein [Muribaculaceae bacterium]
AVTTLTDELKLASHGKSRIYAIAGDAAMAITLAGHAVNGAYWINDNTGRWATTTFYREMPPCLQERNYAKALSLRVDTMKWEPLPATKALVNGVSFYYNFNRNDALRYEHFKDTPLANSEVVDVAIDYIDKLNLGNGEATDCIQLGLSAAVPQWCAAGKGEEVDTYLRLDADLGRLLNAIDAKVGLKNVLVYITSTGSYPDNRDFDTRYNLPQGVFNTERACSLLNVYLMALLGPGEWVECGNGVEFYLNRSLIKSRGLDIDDVGAKARDFLAQMEGVADAFTSHDIITARSTDGRLWAWRNSVVKGRCADVVVDLNAGWRLQPNNDETNVSFRANYGNVLCPLYIMSPQVMAKRLHATYDAAQVAPTVARLCRIRSPNGASFPPLPIQ